MPNEASITSSLLRLAKTTVLPPSALAVMRLSVLDWISVAIAGKEEPVSRIVRDLALHEGGSAQATTLGSPVKLPARAAALVNGTLSHALDYDDTHFAHIGHPSVAVLPAAFAIGELVEASGEAVLAAALIGCEASCRVGLWLGRSHYQHGFHQTATAGTFGATVAAARLLELSEERMAHALGLASTRASGLKSQFGTMGKPFHAGMAASNGVEAALLADRGFISEPRGLEEAQGFGPTHAGSDTPIDDPSNGFLFETVQHKFHACCHGIHAVLEALDMIQSRHGLKTDEIAAIDLEVHPRWLSVCDIKIPKTGLEAKFSYCVSAAAKLSGYDTAALETFSDALCRDETVITLRERVRVQADDTLCETATHVVIRRKNGETVKAAYDLNQPVSYLVREEKILTKAASLIGDERANRIWQRLAALDAIFSLQMLVDA